MEEINLNSWGEFKRHIENFMAEVDALKKESKGKGHVSYPLFRGQADSAWKLQTTLERKIKTSMPVEFYYRHVTSAHRYLTNFSKNNHTVEENPDLSYKRLTTGAWPNYEYLAYLRHHAFPSPLLDWSRSPFVAAFFAFYPEPAIDTSRVAVFSYQEYRGRSKGSSSSQGQIRVQGPWASIHQRHILQQSWYTVCFKNSSKEIPFFCPHDEALASSHLQGTNQDYMVKVTIPTSERKCALKELSRMNINPYSLFHSEDSLIATVSMELFDEIA
jgi:hypothetical protein